MRFLMTGTRNDGAFVAYRTAKNAKKEQIVINNKKLTDVNRLRLTFRSVQWYNKKNIL